MQFYKRSVTEISFKITYLKLCSNLPGANELIYVLDYKSIDALGVTQPW